MLYYLHDSFEWLEVAMGTNNAQSDEDRSFKIVVVGWPSSNVAMLVDEWRKTSLHSGSPFIECSINRVDCVVTAVRVFNDAVIIETFGVPQVQPKGRGGIEPADAEPKLVVEQLATTIARVLSHEHGLTPLLESYNNGDW